MAERWHSHSAGTTNKPVKQEICATCLKDILKTNKHKSCLRWKQMIPHIYLNNEKIDSIKII